MAFGIVELTTGDEKAKARDDKKSEDAVIVMEEENCDVFSLTKRTADGESVIKKFSSNDGRNRVPSLMNPNDTVQAPAKIKKKRKAYRNQSCNTKRISDILKRVGRYNLLEELARAPRGLNVKLFVLNAIFVRY